MYRGGSRIWHGGGVEGGGYVIRPWGDRRGGGVVTEISDTHRPSVLLLAYIALTGATHV